MTEGEMLKLYPQTKMVDLRQWRHLNNENPLPMNSNMKFGQTHVTACHIHSEHSKQQTNEFLI